MDAENRFAVSLTSDDLAARDIKVNMETVPEADSSDDERFIRIPGWYISIFTAATLFQVLGVAFGITASIDNHSLTAQLAETRLQRDEAIKLSEGFRQRNEKLKRQLGSGFSGAKSELGATLRGKRIAEFFVQRNNQKILLRHFEDCVNRVTGNSLILSLPLGTYRHALSAIFPRASADETGEYLDSQPFMGFHAVRLNGNNLGQFAYTPGTGAIYQFATPQHPELDQKIHQAMAACGDQGIGWIDQVVTAYDKSEDAWYAALDRPFGQLTTPLPDIPAATRPPVHTATSRKHPRLKR